MVDRLERAKPARTGLEVGRLALGTAPLASVFWGNDETTAVAAVRRAYERGVRFFDTAPFYGLGESERRLGAGLRAATAGATGLGPSAAAADGTGPSAAADGGDEASASADDGGVVIATKAGRRLEAGPDGSVQAVFDFGYDAARRSVESSLERLGADRVGIVHVHDPDDHLDEALEGTHRALADMRGQKMIDAVSVGTNTVATASVFLERGDLDCMLVAGRYTLLDQSAAGLIAACADRSVAYLAAGVFNSGVLARPAEGAWYDYGPVSAERLERARAIESVCRRHGASLAAAALAFPLAHPSVASVVVGMATPAEVDENLDAAAASVPADLWSELHDAGLVVRPEA